MLIKDTFPCCILAIQENPLLHHIFNFTILKVSMGMVHLAIKIYFDFQKIFITALICMWIHWRLEIHSVKISVVVWFTTCKMDAFNDKNMIDYRDEFVCVNTSGFQSQTPSESSFPHDREISEKYSSFPLIPLGLEIAMILIMLMTCVPYCWDWYSNVCNKDILNWCLSTILPNTVHLLVNTWALSTFMTGCDNYYCLLAQSGMHHGKITCPAIARMYSMA